MSQSTARYIHVRDDLWERVEALAHARDLAPEEVVHAALVTLFSRAGQGASAPAPEPPAVPARPGRPSRPVARPGPRDAVSPRSPSPAGRRPAAGLPPPAARRYAATRPLYLNYGGQWYVIDQDEFVIGRGSKYSDLAIKDANISRRHCAVVRRGGEYYITDLGSTNGIEFHGQRVDNHRIEEGAVYHLCDHEIRFSFIPPA